MTNLLVLQRLMAPAGNPRFVGLTAPRGACRKSQYEIDTSTYSRHAIHQRNRSSAQTFVTAQVHPLEQIQALGHRTFLTNRSEQILPQKPARLDQINRSNVVLT